MSSETTQPHTRVIARQTGVAVVLVALLATVALASLSIGASGMPPADALRALVVWDASTEHALVYDVRLPRVLVAGLVGVNLAVAGVLIQTLTRNPLASPQTFGINAGASLAIVLATIALPSLAELGTVAPALVGATAVGMLMWALSWSGLVTTVGLALAGVTLHLVLASLVQGILIMNNAAQDIVFWLAGSVTTAQWPKVGVILPFTIIGCGTALLASRHFGMLALDSTTGKSLGQHTRRVGGLASVLVVLLAGSAVAVSGPIGFVGLIVPHIVRPFARGDYRWLLTLSAIAGPLLLISADVGGRLVSFPQEVPVGIVTALLGAPTFLVLAAQRRRP